MVITLRELPDNKNTVPVVCTDIASANDSG